MLTDYASCIQLVDTSLPQQNLMPQKAVRLPGLLIYPQKWQPHCCWLCPTASVHIWMSKMVERGKEKVEPATKPKERHCDLQGRGQVSFVSCFNGKSAVMMDSGPGRGPAHIPFFCRS